MKKSARQFEVLVIGAGPAGMAASVCAAESGCRVGLVDDNPGLGGQIWRGEAVTHAAEAAPWLRRFKASGVEPCFGTRVFHSIASKTLLAEGPDLCELSFEKLILATGARERFLPFPGWTLPNVMGAGGLQALVKSGLPIAGKRVVVAGSGPLLMAVAAYLHAHGAVIPIICEQAPRTALARFGMALLAQPAKIKQGLTLRKELSGIPYVPNSWPMAALGKQALESVMISRGSRTEEIPCDYLACGFHLVPNIELAALLGCSLEEGYVRVNEFQQTSVENVFCAGEPTSIGGLDLSLAEGEIAGLATAGKAEAARKLFGARDKLRKFVRVLDRAFALRPELRSLPLAETIVCRCEDVTYRRFDGHASWRSAKLHTRCGMGPCQGRICGPATEFLFGWRPDSVRPPIFPVRFGNLATIECNAELHEMTGAH